MSNTNTKAYMRWTKEDKVKLLHGLKIFGYRDLRNIGKLLPNKSSNAIRTMIYKYSILARESLKNDNSLDDWLRFKFFKDSDSMISEALLYISLFEGHPPPSETGDINVRAFYDLLYRASTEQSLPDLTTRDIEALSNLHEVLRLRMSPSTESDVLKYLNSVNDESENENKRDYSRKKK